MGCKGYGPVEYPKLTKKTGNTLAEQGAFNDLVNISDEFYYTLQTEIPEEHPAYYWILYHHRCTPCRSGFRRGCGCQDASIRGKCDFLVSAHSEG